MNTKLESPVISVIIPCYNGEKYIGEAIQSVLDQSYTDIEVIVVDDGSTDSSAAVINQFDDPRLKYIYQSNKGLSGARNTGITNAQGRYLSFLDADDLMYSDNLKYLLEYIIQHDEYGLVCHAFHRINAKGEIIYSSKRLKKKVIDVSTQLTTNQLIICGNLIPKEIILKIQGFDEELRGGEEWFFHSRIALTGKKMVILPDVQCCYRVVSNSLSQKIEFQKEMRLLASQKLYTLPEATPYQSYRNKAESWIYLKAGVGHFVQGNRLLGLENVVTALGKSDIFSQKNFQPLVNYLFTIDNFHELSGSSSIFYKILNEEKLNQFFDQKTKLKMRRELNKLRAVNSLKNNDFITFVIHSLNYLNYSFK